MNILLTGGAGYIGSHTAVVLCDMGHKVILFDNLSNSKVSVVQRLGQITGKLIPFIQGDVRDKALLTEVLSEYEIDAVIHFAGLKAVGESNEKPLDYYSSNVEGTISLLQAMQEQQINALVFSSSATVYGQPQYLPLDEAHPTAATNPYGRTKLHIEQMLQDLTASNPHWRIAILRYFNPVGAHPSGLIGDDPNGTPNNLMPYLALVATGKLPHLNIWGNDYPTLDGTGVRDYIHIVDVAEGHAAALAYIEGNCGCNIFNLGTGQAVSVLELLKVFEKALQKKINYVFKPRRKGDVACIYSDPILAEKKLFWRAKFSLEEVCISVVKYNSEMNKV